MIAGKTSGNNFISLPQLSPPLSSNPYPIQSKQNQQPNLSHQSHSPSQQHPPHSRETGKQTVFHALQDPTDDLSATTIAELDAEASVLRTSISASKAAEKALRTELAALTATVSMAELRSSLSGLQAEKDALVSRVERLKEGVKDGEEAGVEGGKEGSEKGGMVSKEEREDVEKSLKLWRYRAGARRKACLQLWAVVSEHLPEGVDGGELWESLGLEGEGVSMVC